MHAGCVFVAGIHICRVWMSGSFESVRCVHRLDLDLCVHRLDLDLYSHPKEFWGNGVRTHVNSKGKFPSTRGWEVGWTRDAASRRAALPRFSDRRVLTTFCSFPWLLAALCTQGVSQRLLRLTCCNTETEVAYQTWESLCTNTGPTRPSLGLIPPHVWQGGDKNASFF